MHEDGVYTGVLAVYDIRGESAHGVMSLQGPPWRDVYLGVWGLRGRVLGVRDVREISDSTRSQMSRTDRSCIRLFLRRHCFSFQSPLSDFAYFPLPFLAISAALSVCGSRQE